MKLNKFIDLSRSYNLIPLVARMEQKNETPLSLYIKLTEGKINSFLLESEGTSQKGYSFIGIEPDKTFRATEQNSSLLRGKLEEYLSCKRAPAEDLPPFSGGLAGYFGYGMVGTWEDMFHNSGRKLVSSTLPQAVLMGFVTIVAIDHEAEEIVLIHNVRIPEEASESSLVLLYKEGIKTLENLKGSIKKNIDTRKEEMLVPCLGPIEANTSKNEFIEMVQKGREHVVAGDICQVVLSQKFSAHTNLPSLEIYESLKEINPSPYLYYLNLPELELIGSSPEVLVRLQDGHVTTRPLAGTRKRGKTAEEDKLLKADLLSDEKELAEHLMLVDLSRNDLGRICSTGTVEVTELMEVEHYSQVMHIVSQVEGTIAEGLSSLDLLESAFPAGTVSGAPKIRAMEIIEELEVAPRGPYAGAVGYLDFGGNLDTCITIRTFLREGEKMTVQAGAGIVYDSVPIKEYEETINKASALFKALDLTMQRSEKR